MIRAVQDCVDDDGRAVQCRSFGRRGRQSLTAGRPGVGLDRATGLAWAGGYFGSGVAIANLSGRTLTDLITGQESDLPGLPWVGHRSRCWGPEPYRWLGVNGGLTAAGLTDFVDQRRG
jgi:hypothetical protein